MYLVIYYVIGGVDGIAEVLGGMMDDDYIFGKVLLGLGGMCVMDG